MQDAPKIWGQSAFTVKGEGSGDPLRWTPAGFVQTGLDLPGEDVRTYSWYGVTGTKKYPFGKAFKDPWEISGWNLGQMDTSLSLYTGLITVILLVLVFKFYS